ncbi:formylmethanofuran dehydrogenase subunit C [Candidatus Bathyarchaeota archaeon]|nr:MAG: formylmethanofuran dehydrogenase subunit C [Candidatus Bathyarchaeota archaeon]
MIKPRRIFKVPVYADCLSPDRFAGRSLKEIMKLEVWEGNKKRSLGDLFEIHGEAADSPENLTLQISGDLRKVRMIGCGMTGGKILIDGDVGMHLGERMQGGEILVNGNVDSWAGCMMSGGKIEVKGSAGDYLGAPYRGSRNGLKGGSIIVHGDVGNEAGCFMRGGVIKVYGNAKDFVGIHMQGGEILVAGNCQDRAGAGMIGGKIVICGHVSSILPTFTIEEIRKSVKVNGEKIMGPFYRFSGDIADQGQGRLYVSKGRNPHLRFYEEYL